MVEKLNMYNNDSAKLKEIIIKIISPLFLCFHCCRDRNAMKKMQNLATYLND